MGSAAKYEGGGTIWEASYTTADDFCVALCHAAGLHVPQSDLGFPRPDRANFEETDPLRLFCNNTARVPTEACTALADRMEALRATISNRWTDDPKSPWKGTLDTFIVALREASKLGVGIYWE